MKTQENIKVIDGKIKLHKQQIKQIEKCLEDLFFDYSVEDKRFEEKTISLKKEKNNLLKTIKSLEEKKNKILSEILLF